MFSSDSDSSDKKTLKKVAIASLQGDPKYSQKVLATI
jgi:hypothetical protein